MWIWYKTPILYTYIYIYIYICLIVDIYQLDPIRIEKFGQKFITSQVTEGFQL